jgi:3,4-dihydroxy 2-butanone 4-phosphate synthase/GTP cyclohydrolase II
MNSAFETWLERQLSGWKADQRPWVTLTYAQSLDGSIAARRGQSLAISGTASLHLTHRLRAMHEAILVGVGTVRADNPRLTVRFAEGGSPQPVVIDGRARCPTSSALFHNPRRPWLACLDSADPRRLAKLRAAGAEILSFQADDLGRIPLEGLLQILVERGVRSVMVEGGASVLTSFLKARLVDAVAVTVAPRFIGGLSALVEGVEVNLQDMKAEAVGEDFLLWGRLA